MKRSEDMEQKTVELSKEIDKERDTSNKLKQLNVKVEQEVVELKAKVTNAEGLQHKFKLEIGTMKNKLETAYKKKPEVRRKASRVNRISTHENDKVIDPPATSPLGPLQPAKITMEELQAAEDEEKNQDDLDYEPKKPGGRGSDRPTVKARRWPAT